VSRRRYGLLLKVIFLFGEVRKVVEIAVEEGLKPEHHGNAQKREETEGQGSRGVMGTKGAEECERRRVSLCIGGRRVGCGPEVF
jgi:hypothetical protein